MPMPTGNGENAQFYGQWTVQDSQNGLFANVYKDKEFYQLGFQVCWPWKFRVVCHLKTLPVKLPNFISNTHRTPPHSPASNWPRWDNHQVKASGRHLSIYSATLCSPSHHAVQSVVCHQDSTSKMLVILLYVILCPITSFEGFKLL